MFDAQAAAFAGVIARHGDDQMLACADVRTLRVFVDANGYTRISNSTATSTAEAQQAQERSVVLSWLDKARFIKLLLARILSTTNTNSNNNRG